MEDFLRAGIFRLLALLPALTLHEFAHAWSAVQAGDPTPQMQGRVTLNPLAHLDPIGTLAILFLPIGWAKPVPVNPRNFRDPRRDSIVTSALGPLSNIAQGIFWALVIRLLLAVAPWAVLASSSRATLVGGMLAFMVLLNFALAIFNLIPLGPLDGHHIMENVLPYPESMRYSRFNNQYGMMAMIGLLVVGSMSGLLYYVISVPAEMVGRTLAGASIRWMIYTAGLFPR